MNEMERRETYIEIADKITRIEVCLAKEFADISGQHKSMMGNINDLKKESEQVIHCLYGNGQEGITTKIAKMNQRLGIMWALLWSAGIGLSAMLAYFLSHFADKII